MSGGWKKPPAKLAMGERYSRFGSLGIGWRLTKVSLGILRKEKSLLALPILSFVLVAMAWSASFASLFLIAPPWDEGNVAVWTVGLPVITFLLYALSFFLLTYFTAAVVGIATVRLEGGDPTLADGFRAASGSVGRLVQWAFLSATVFMILRAVRKRTGWAGPAIAGAAGIAWGLATYFVIPVLVFEKRGPWEALKRSASLVAQRFGEWAGSGMALVLLLGFPAFFGSVAILLIGVAAGTSEYEFLGGTAVGISPYFLLAALLYALILGCIYAAAKGVLVAALYRYATTDRIAPEFPREAFAAPASAPPPALLGGGAA